MNVLQNADSQATESFTTHVKVTNCVVSSFNRIVCFVNELDLYFSLKAATSRGVCGFWVQTILKYVVGDLNIKRKI